MWKSGDGHERSGREPLERLARLVLGREHHRAEPAQHRALDEPEDAAVAACRTLGASGRTAGEQDHGGIVIRDRDVGEALPPGRMRAGKGSRTRSRSPGGRAGGAETGEPLSIGDQDLRSTELEAVANLVRRPPAVQRRHDGAPELTVAQKAMIHSGWFSARIATRSPGPTRSAPGAARAAARRAGTMLVIADPPIVEHDAPRRHRVPPRQRAARGASACVA